MLTIKDWLERFEATREKDRPRKPMDWIRLPCDLQSTGYGTLMSTPTGAQHLGVFVALIELVAGLAIAVRDGTLVSPQGEPLPIRALSIKTRIPVRIMEESITALKECGWLQEGDYFPGNSGKFPGPRPLLIMIEAPTLWLGSTVAAGSGKTSLNFGPPLSTTRS